MHVHYFTKKVLTISPLHYTVYSEGQNVSIIEEFPTDALYTVVLLVI